MKDRRKPQEASASQVEAMRAAAKRIDRVNDWLQVGGAVPPDQYERLVSGGISHVVDLREEKELESGIERLATLGIERRHVPVPNFTAPATEQLLTIVHWLETSEPRGAVYVHCGGGFGRAATIAAGLLILRGASVDQAIDELRMARPEIRINDSQLEWLHSVEAQARNMDG